MNRGNAWHRTGAAEQGAANVACTSYLARHSAYLDGELTPQERQVHEAHAAGCAACARYASVLHRGARLLRELPELEPATDFHQRLQHRIFHVQDEAVLAAERTRRVSWLAAAATVALVAGGGLLLEWHDRGPSAELASTMGRPRATSNQLADSWTTPPVPLTLPDAPVPPPAFAGYSPLVVRPPLYQPVSYELLAGE